MLYGKNIDIITCKPKFLMIKQRIKEFYVVDKQSHIILEMMLFSSRNLDFKMFLNETVYNIIEF